MNKATYEALGYYAYTKGREHSVADLIVINADDYSIGLCKSDQNGVITVLDVKAVETGSSCMEDINSSIQAISEQATSLPSISEPEREAFNALMRRYYQSDKQMNSDLKAVMGISIDCAKVDNCFDTARRKIGYLLSDAERLLAKNGLDEYKCGIIVAGKAADYFPIYYCLRSRFSFDPFLKDARFLTDSFPDSPGEIVNVAMAEYEQYRKRMREVYIHYINPDNRDEKARLPEISLKEINDDATGFWGPVLLKKGSELELEIESQRFSKAIPEFTDSEECNLIGVAAGLSEGKKTVRVIKYNQSSVFYDFFVD